MRFWPTGCGTGRVLEGARRRVGADEDDDDEVIRPVMLDNSPYSIMWENSPYCANMLGNSPCLPQYNVG